MKKGLKKVLGFVGFIYLVIAIIAIVCLLKKNTFGYPQFGSKTLLVMEEDSKETGFKKGDLVVLYQPSSEEMQVNDVVFFYDTEYAKNTINVGRISNKEVINEKEATLTIASKSISSEYIVGKVNESKSYATIGSILNVLLSKWGFFLIIIVPFFIMFMIELFAIYTEIKYGKKENN